MRQVTDWQNAVSQRLWIVGMGNVQRFLRFGLVGGSGVVVNMGVLYLLTTVGGIHPIVAAILGTEAAIVSNFVLNDHWTFRDALPAATCHARFLRYNVFALGGMLLSVTTLATLTYGFGLHYLLANLAAIGAATLWNYIANARWTWTLPCADPLSSASGDA